MLEILQIIILACQVSGSNTGFVKKIQEDCRKDMIECMESLKTSDVGGSWGKERLVYCLKEKE